MRGEFYAHYPQNQQKKKKEAKKKKICCYYKFFDIIKNKRRYAPRDGWHTAV